MEANAPERLYLSKNIYSTYLYQVPDPNDETAVEYTRTDAFIEKACEFLAGNMKCDGYTLQTKAKFIRGFRNYMKGE